MKRVGSGMLADALMEQNMRTEVQRHILAALSALPLTVLIFGFSTATFSYIV